MKKHLLSLLALLPLAAQAGVQSVNTTNAVTTIDIPMSQYIREYWNSNMTCTNFNVSVPMSTSDADPSHCVFNNDLNAPFVTSNGIIAGNQLNSVNFYFDANHINGSAVMVGNHSVRYTVSTDGLTLSASVDNNAYQQIAQINNNAYTPSNHVMLLETDNAKALLNDQTDANPFTAPFRAVGNIAGNDVTITFNYSDHYQARWNAPLKFTQQAVTETFLDGADFGATGSYINMSNAFNLQDWRGRQLYNYPTYPSYYGVTGYSIDFNNVECDINGIRQKLPATIGLGMYNQDGVLIGATNSSMPSSVNWSTQDPSQIGYLAYKNDGIAISQPFNIYIQLQVNHKWGTLTSEYIYITVGTENANFETLDITTADYIQSYWNSSLSYTSFSASLPQGANDSNPAHCTFNNDLNAPFVTHNGIVGGDILNSIDFYFDSDIANSAGYTVGEHRVKYNVSSDGLVLSASIDGNNFEQIAKITNDASARANWVELLETNNAKTLLNDQTSNIFFALFRAVGHVGVIDVPLTFNHYKNFMATWNAPLRITSPSVTGHFVDGTDFGDPGSYVKLESPCRVLDWIDHQVDGNVNLAGFYDMSLKAEAEMYLNETWNPIPGTLSIGIYDKNGQLKLSINGSPNTISLNTQDLSEYGYVTYMNNGGILNESASLAISVIAEYKWGTVKETWPAIAIEPYNSNGIGTIMNDTKTSVFHDLNGRQLRDKPSTKGVYLMGGKKFVVR